MRIKEFNVIILGFKVSWYFPAMFLQMYEFHTESTIISNNERPTFHFQESSIYYFTIYIFKHVYLLYIHIYMLAHITIY